MADRDINLITTPELHKRLGEVEAALPPEGMSVAEVVRRGQARRAGR